MCGRTCVGQASLSAAANFAGVNRESVPKGCTACVNFGPGNSAAIVAAQPDGSRRIIEAKWGLFPSWQAKRGDQPNFFAMFNARAESVHEKPSFNSLVAGRGRCVCPIDGFYEWRRLAPSDSKSKQKQPYYITLGDGPVYVAALYETVTTTDGTELTTFTLLTAAACPVFQTMHDRQPVFLDEEQALQWLAPGNVCAPTSSFLQEIQDHQHSEHGLLQSRGKWHAVTPSMGNIKYQKNDCVAPYQPALSKLSWAAAPAPPSAAAASATKGAARGDVLKMESKNGEGEGVEPAACTKVATAEGKGGGWGEIKQEGIASIALSRSPSRSPSPSPSRSFLKRSSFFGASGAATAFPASPVSALAVAAKGKGKVSTTPGKTRSSGHNNSASSALWVARTRTVAPAAKTAAIAAATGITSFFEAKGKSTRSSGCSNSSSSSSSSGGADGTSNKRQKCSSGSGSGIGIGSTQEKDGVVDLTD